MKKHWIVNTESLLVYSRDNKALLQGEEGFESEFDAYKHVLSEAKKREDKAYNEYIEYCKTASQAAMRMKDLTC